MNSHTFWLYSFAAICVVWGALGARFALSVAVANGVLAVLMFSVAERTSGELSHALMLCYPIYWGVAFAAFRFLDRLALPVLAVPWRVAAGCLLTLVFLVCANWLQLARSGELFRVTYLTEPATRAQDLENFFRGADKVERCEDSYSSLMRLAVRARDVEVLKTLFSTFSVCDNAATTITEVALPAIDAGDAARVELFLEAGMSPLTVVLGHDYANGTAFAYAATAADRPDMVKLLFSASPEAVRGMKYLYAIIETLKQQNNAEMLELFNTLDLL